jgi:hypothetical protein
VLKGCELVNSQFFHRDFLEKIIDYAGLFPPSALCLDEAINQYASYINSEESWMVGPFVLPVSMIENLPPYADLFLQKKPLTLSIVGRKSETEKEWLEQLKNDMDLVQTYAGQYSQWLKVEVLEIALPPGVPTRKTLEELTLITQPLGLKVFCEVSLHPQNEFMLTLDTICSFNGQLGVKLRTGGVKAEMFPSSEQVAYGMIACRDRQLPLKFTAGLHHPIRIYRDEVNTKMHGFINIFLAGMLAYHHQLDADRVTEIISDENQSHFTVSNDYMAYKDLNIPTQEIHKLRKHSLCSFGSCSFDEPKDEFLEFRMQQGGIK